MSFFFFFFFSVLAVSHLKHLDKNLGACTFFIPNHAFNLQQWHSISSIYMMFKIFHNRMHPLNSELPSLCFRSSVYYIYTAGNSVGNIVFIFSLIWWNYGIVLYWIRTNYSQLFGTFLPGRRKKEDYIGFGLKRFLFTWMHSLEQCVFPPYLVILQIKCVGMSCCTNKNIYNVIPIFTNNT